MMKKCFWMIVLGIVLQGCKAFWPYKSDFDCPILEGEYCKSLYEVSQMADAGKFAPELYFERLKQKEAVRCKKCKVRGC